jgi:hypothetical protein
LQAGVIGYSKGQKIIGSGKAFSFASYGALVTNVGIPVNTDAINVIELASTEYPIQILVPLNSMKNLDFSTAQTVANVIIDGASYPITVVLSSNRITLGCTKTISLQAFYGKDEYV